MPFKNYKKVQDCIKSCKTPEHLETANTMLSLFIGLHPESLVYTTHLQCALQLKRIDINHLAAQCDGVNERFVNRVFGA
jgi:hypothetical protein